jgi:hypothetical protein
MNQTRTKEFNHPKLETNTSSLLAITLHYSCLFIILFCIGIQDLNHIIFIMSISTINTRPIYFCFSKEYPTCALGLSQQQFSQNSKLFNTFSWASSVPNFIPVRGKLGKCGHMSFTPFSKVWLSLHNLALCGYHLYRISPRPVKKCGKYS